MELRNAYRTAAPQRWFARPPGAAARRRRSPPAATAHPLPLLNHLCCVWPPKHCCPAPAALQARATNAKRRPAITTPSARLSPRGRCDPKKNKNRNRCFMQTLQLAHPLPLLPSCPAVVDHGPQGLHRGGAVLSGKRRPGRPSLSARPARAAGAPNEHTPPKTPVRKCVNSSA